MIVSLLRPARPACGLVAVPGEVEPGQGGLDLRDAVRPDAPDLAELVAGMEVDHVADRARLVEGRVVGAGQRVEAVQRQDGEQALNRAVTGNRPVVGHPGTGR